MTPYSTTKNVLGCGLLSLSLCPPPPPPLPFPTPFQPFHALLHCIIPLLPSRSISSPSPSSGPQRENSGPRGAHAHNETVKKKEWRAAHDFLVFLRKKGKVINVQKPNKQKHVWWFFHCFFCLFPSSCSSSTSRNCMVLI